MKSLLRPLVGIVLDLLVQRATKEMFPNRKAPQSQIEIAAKGLQSIIKTVSK